MVRRKGLLYPVAVWLGAVAIAGLLSMHGLSPAVFQLGQASSHDIHGMEPAEEASHTGIGLCVFAVIGLVGLAALTSAKPRRNPRSLARFSSAPLTRQPGLTAAGRQLLADLCVLRL